MKIAVAVLFCLCTGMTVFGREIRVVSLSPALTELVCHLGRESVLVGRSAACDVPETVKKLPVAGNFGSPFLEKLAVLKPDWVIANVFQDVSSVKSIESMGIRVAVFPLNSIADYRNAVSGLGKLLGAEKLADEELSRVDRTVNGLRKRHPEDCKRPKVLFAVWSSPLLLPGKWSFLPELILLAGGDPIGGDTPQEYFRASPEWVLKTDPDVVIFPDGKASGIPSWWTQLNACRENRLFMPEDAGLFFRLSPRTGAMLLEMERLLRK